MASLIPLVTDPLDTPNAGVIFYEYSAQACAVLITFFHMRVDFFLMQDNLKPFVELEPVESLAHLCLSISCMNQTRLTI
jgi:hypothetical protein